MPDIDREKQNIEDRQGSGHTIGKAGATRGLATRPWQAKQLLIGLACVGLAACSSGSDGTNLFNTTYDGFPAAGSTIDGYTIRFTGPDCSDPDQQISVIEVVLSDSAGGCAAAQAGRARPSTTDLDLIIVGQSATPGAAPPPYAQVLAAQEKNESNAIDVGPAASDGAGNFYTFDAVLRQRDTACQTTATAAISDEDLLSAVQIQTVDTTEVKGEFRADFAATPADIGLSGIFDQAHGCPLTNAQFCALSTGTLTCQ